MGSSRRQHDEKPRAALKLAEFLCFGIYAAGRAFNRLYKPLLEKVGLTYPQYLVMVLLWDRDGRTVGELGEELFLESNTLTPLLKRLEAIGHIARSRDAADERQVRLRLTPGGRALRAKAQDVPQCVLDATGLSPKEARRLLDDITTLRATLKSRSAG